MIQRSSTELGTTIDEQMMHELPLNGRNFTQLLILQPGVNPVDTAQGGNGVGGSPMAATSPFPAPSSTARR